MDNCPVCKRPPEISCYGWTHSHRCQEGHWWYTCPVHSIVALGRSSYGKCRCACPKPATHPLLGDPD